MTAFTPAPWTAKDEAGNSITIRAASKSSHELGWEIASIYNEEMDTLTETMWADARLIAAAPELLSALRSVTAWAEKLEAALRGELNIPAGAFLNEFCDEARAAIRKATGAPAS